MESITKNKQTDNIIIKMVQKAFGEELKPEDIRITELTEGFFNVAYEIGLPGREVILKVAPQTTVKIMSYEKNIMQAEVEGLQLAKKYTSVPVPEVILHDTSKSICDSDYFFMEKLYGESFYTLKCKDMPLKEQEDIYCEVGRLNREINRIVGDRFGYLEQPDPFRRGWKEVFIDMISDILEDGEKINISLGIDYNEVRSLLHKAEYALEEVEQPVLVHWDLWEGNIFVKDGKISGIIDFERSMWADPLMEYGFRHHSIDEQYIKGYGTNLRSIAPVRALLYDIYLYLILIIETKYRNYPNDWQINFALKELKAVIDELKAIN